MDAEIDEIRARVKDFVEQQLLPLEPRSLPEGGLPREDIPGLQRAAREAGLWGYDIPEEYDGLGFSLAQICAVAEELGKTKAVSFRKDEILGPNVYGLLYALEGKQEEEYLWPVLNGQKRAVFAQTEPHTGSDPKSMRTTAEDQGSSYVLNGSKRWIGGAEEADFALVICRTREKRGQEVSGDLSCLVVDLDAPGVRLVRQFDTMMGDRPWEIAFQDVEVPKDHLVGLEGGGFELAQGWLTRNRIAHHGARVVGIGKRALDLMTRRAAERITFGKPLADRQAVTGMVSQSAIELKTAELLVYDTARQFDAGQPVRNEAFMVKLHCTEVGLQVVDRAMQVFGAIGLSSEYPLEYFFRQLRSLQITEGPREVLSWRLGRRIIREVAETSS